MKIFSLILTIVFLSPSSPVRAALPIAAIKKYGCEMKSLLAERDFKGPIGTNLKWAAEARAPGKMRFQYGYFPLMGPYLGWAYIEDTRTRLRLILKNDRLVLLYPSEGRYFKSVSFEVPAELRELDAEVNEATDARVVALEKLERFWNSEVQSKFIAPVESTVLRQLLRETSLIFGVQPQDVDTNGTEVPSLENLLHPDHIANWERLISAASRNLPGNRIQYWEFREFVQVNGAVRGVSLIHRIGNKTLTVEVKDGAIVIVSRRKREQQTRRAALTNFMKLQSWLQNISYTEVLLRTFPQVFDDADREQR